MAPPLKAELTAQLAQKTLAEQAKHLLAGQPPGIEDRAGELHLSTRTFQRRLTEQNITFQRLLDEARRELPRAERNGLSIGLRRRQFTFRAFQHWEALTRTLPRTPYILVDNPSGRSVTRRDVNSNESLDGSSPSAKGKDAGVDDEAIPCTRPGGYIAYVGVWHGLRSSASNCSVRTFICTVDPLRCKGIRADQE